MSWLGSGVQLALIIHELFRFILAQAEYVAQDSREGQIAQDAPLVVHDRDGEEVHLEHESQSPVKRFVRLYRGLLAVRTNGVLGCACPHKFS